MISSSFETLFDRRFLAQLEALHFLSRQKIRGRLRAERRSTEKGASLEFEEYRPFTTGDDLRMIDWKVFARWRQLVVKLFVEEQDLHLHLLLDGTHSMDWGDPNKFDYARKMAAGFAFLGLCNLDRVALCLLGTPPDGSWKSVRGRNKFLPMLRNLASSNLAREGVGLTESVQQWTKRQPRRGKVLVISDLLGTGWEDAAGALDRIRYQRHELAVLQVLDPTEAQAGDFGEYRFEDQEYGHSETIAVQPSSRLTYERSFREYTEKMKKYCSRHRISYLQVWTTENPWDLFMKAFREGGFIH